MTLLGPSVGSSYVSPNCFPLCRAHSRPLGSSLSPKVRGSGSGNWVIPLPESQPWTWLTAGVAVGPVSSRHVALVALCCVEVAGAGGGRATFDFPTSCVFLIPPPPPLLTCEPSDP